MAASRRPFALFGVGLLSLFMLGCHKTDNSATSSGATNAASGDMAASPRKVRGGGAVPDTSATPAPAGVATGNYAGGRK